MFESIRYHHKHRQLLRKKRKNEQESRIAIDKEADRADRDLMIQLFFYEQDTYDDSLAQLQSIYIQKTAEKYLIPVPALNLKSGWETSDITGNVRMTSDTRAKLLKAIREEKKQRREEMLGWLPIVTATTGLLGVVVAILALLFG